MSSSSSPASQGRAPEDVSMRNKIFTELSNDKEETKFNLYHVYKSAAEIDYRLDEAVKQGLFLTTVLNTLIKALNLSAQRKEVWSAEIESLQSFTFSPCIIALCGATGAAKSSMANAILDANILPTSGMQACTSAVIEVSHHDKSTIKAEISMISSQEWTNELQHLCDDVIGPGGSNRIADKNKEAGIAWAKVQAVYPQFKRVEELALVTFDEILASNPAILQMLGTKQVITASTPKSFAKKIARFVDQKQGARPGDAIDAAASPYLWPLVGKVQVYCNSPALSSGATLVDLPGVADSNAARSSIAKEYLKKADFVWIVAPIQRAIDEKAAQDLLGTASRSQMMNGQYDAKFITFIATKTDDVSCDEVIRPGNLQDDPALKDIERQLQHCKSDTKKHTKAKMEIEKTIKGLIQQQEKASASLETLTAPPARDTIHTHTDTAGTKKHELTATLTRRPVKRARLDDGPTTTADAGTNAHCPEDGDSTNVEEDINCSGEDITMNFVSEPQDTGEEDDEMEDEGLRAELERKAEETKELLSQAKEHLGKCVRALENLHKQQSASQKKKTAFCSLKRSEFACQEIKSRFRSSLKELDDLSAEAENPEDFDPDEDIRDYNNIDLPTFACSPREYRILKGFITGDGQTKCFSSEAETGIPALQMHCSSLPLPSRERAVEDWLVRIKTFAVSVHTALVQGEDGFTADRTKLRERWESARPRYGRARRGIVSAAATQSEDSSVTHRLNNEFRQIVKDNTQGLRSTLRGGLAEKCRAGASAAEEVAVSTTNDFINTPGMHHNTLRAVIRRDGSWRDKDLNVLLCDPYTNKIASSWRRVFEYDHFAQLKEKVMQSIDQLMDDIEISSGAEYKPKVRQQGELCKEEVRVALQSLLQIVHGTLNAEQKEASRSLGPHIQDELIAGYTDAKVVSGKGSVAAQKRILLAHVEENKSEIFVGATEIIFDHLDNATQEIEATLQKSLQTLAKKVEVNLSVLWGEIRDDSRHATVQQVSEILAQANFWVEASQRSNRAV